MIAMVATAFPSSVAGTLRAHDVRESNATHVSAPGIQCHRENGNPAALHGAI